MIELRNKTILIISPQSWGKMFVSKHHYAVELAKRGNKVYFLNPPDQTSIRFTKAVEIVETGIAGLSLINHSLFFPYWLKFKALSIFHGLMRFHIQRFLKRIDPVDIVWSFDLGYLYPFKFFDNKSYKIFHPVDEPLTPEAIHSAFGAQIIFSITREILEKYISISVPRHFINHGVSEEFLISEIKDYKRNEPVRIGVSGNLLRPDIDRQILLAIVKQNSELIFEFWGSFESKDSNMGGEDNPETKSFVSQLRQCQNTIFHGAVTSSQLSKEIKRVDVFLICYDVIKDQSKGTNYHKVMEYLATGKVIVANNITTYKNNPELVSMVEERDTNDKLPELFRFVIRNLEEHNSLEMQRARLAFAADNLYANQLLRIEKLIG